MPNLTKILTVSAAAAALAGAASAQMDYHGFDQETVDQLNERLESPVTGDQLAVLSNYTDIETCGGDMAAEKLSPDGWEARLATASTIDGDIVLPVPTTALAPEYPPLYQVLGVEGACEAIFSVSASGQTENVIANCTLPAFSEATTAMLTELEFEPADGADSAETGDILLPVNYCLPDEEEAAN